MVEFRETGGVENDLQNFLKYTPSLNIVYILIIISSTYKYSIAVVLKVCSKNPQGF